MVLPARAVISNKVPMLCGDNRIMRCAGNDFKGVEAKRVNCKIGRVNNRSHGEDAPDIHRHSITTVQHR